MNANENRAFQENRQWWDARKWLSRAAPRTPEGPRIGLALGGGFARGIAHIGVLHVFEKHRIPLHAISGVSAGAMVAAAFASGTTAKEIESIGKSMKFSDVARWTISRLGLAGSDRMISFLARLLKVNQFEDMKVPLAVVATDLASGRPLVFRDKGEVVSPIRGSCSFPGLFLPLRYQNRYLVDGFVSMEVPAHPLKQMGCTHVVSVSIPNERESVDPSSIFSVIDRCFQVMSSRLETEWRRHSSVVIEPDCANVDWDCFASAHTLIELGEKAAMAKLPEIQRWLSSPRLAPSFPYGVANALLSPVDTSGSGLQS